jgi:RNA polymerase sigma factor (sigma-70 family)
LRLEEGRQVSRTKDAILQELLVLRCRRGERPAFDELIRLWERRLFYYVRRLVATEEDAWDVLQQTWMKVFKGIRTLNAPERLPIWLYQIARCTALSHWRGHYRQQARMEEHDDLSEIAAVDASDHFDDCEQVHLGLSRISLAHREVLTLHFLEDFSLEQMAEVLGIPPGTAKSRLFYAKRALRAVLERKEGDR